MLWHPYTQMQTAPDPLPVARAEGVYLYMDDGRRVMDAISSWWVNIHGHAHPVLNRALAEQAARLEHVMFAGFTHEPAVELAERLTAVLPSGLTRVFYSDDGSTAVEVALKMALQYWQNVGQSRRTRFVAMRHAYHGDTGGAMSVGDDSEFTEAFGPLLFPIDRAEPPYCYRCPLGLTRATCRIDCLGSLEQVLKKGGGEVAAVILEPMVQAAGGMITWPAEYLAGARALCDRHGTLLIADEVLTGFGRTGKMFACEHAGISPDIICLSKALTAGYLPMGATVATEPIFESFLSDDRHKTFFHGHSFTANPLACAVGAASLALFETDGVLARVRRLEAQLKAGLAPLAALPAVGDVRVIGGIGILELVADKATRASGGYLDELGPSLAAAFLERGALVRPLGNIVYVMPPYVITDAEVDWLIAQVAEVVGAIPA